MSDPEPLELGPADVPRTPPTAVTMGDGSSQQRWRRGGLAALGLLAVVAAATVASRDPPAPGVAKVDRPDARVFPALFEEPPTPVEAVPSGAHAVASIDGGLLVEGFGRFFVRTPDSLHPVASGAFIAAAGRWLATQSCDDTLRCGVHLVDLGTGQDRVLDVGTGWDLRLPHGSFSPDGQTLALWLYGEQRARLVFVDTVTATVADLPEPRRRCEPCGS